ncbi:hypothetical protein SDJN02_27490, partial [Cucurbita argyrosperma subsp. argyrosperma]
MEMKNATAFNPPFLSFSPLHSAFELMPHLPAFNPFPSAFPSDFTPHCSPFASRISHRSDDQVPLSDTLSSSKSDVFLICGAE